MLKCQTSNNADRLFKSGSATLLHRTVFLLLFPFFLVEGVCSLQPERKVFFNIANFRSVCVVSNFKNIEYFSWDNNFNKHLAKNKSFQKYSLKFGKTSLVFFIGTFYFVLIDETNESEIFQLTLPTIEVSGMVYVPLTSFLNCIEKSQKYDVSIINNNVTLRKRKSNIALKTEAKHQHLKRETTETIIETQKIDETTETHLSNPSTMPKVNLTIYELLSLEKDKEFTTKKRGVKQRKPIESPKKAVTDTTGKVPPKYYVLPPELKNNPK
ncbi:MAG: hypothetical protein N2517_05870 [Ignavibacteria bacterium]|nr:hypothetical protein [Ignavibacteria bacterium]